MNLKDRARKVWHEIFVRLDNKSLFKLADTCQNVVTSIDLNEEEKTLTKKARFMLHLSMCQACMNYYRFSKSLSTAIKKPSPLSPSQKSANLESLQKRLLAEMAEQTKK